MYFLYGTIFFLGCIHLFFRINNVKAQLVSNLPLGNCYFHLNKPRNIHTLHYYLLCLLYLTAMPAHTSDLQTPSAYEQEEESTESEEDGQRDEVPHSVKVTRVIDDGTQSFFW